MRDGDRHVAEYWRRRDNGAVICELCPHKCLIEEGNSGQCSLRSNLDGELIATGYGELAALAIDPIEKKPLYHFYPGSQILSVGPNGCNMRCRGCQNYSISQRQTATEYILPEQLVALCRERHSPGIAFTYTEPLIWFEYLRDAARTARDEEIYSVIVSNGYICPEPLKELTPYLGAANIDVKSFRPDFYKDYCGAKLEPVLDTCVYLKGRIHLELTYLLIPGLNDTTEEIEGLVSWIVESLGRDTPLHISAYFPHYEMQEPGLRPIGFYSRKNSQNANYTTYTSVMFRVSAATILLVRNVVIS